MSEKMAENTKISWTDSTLNFWHGCVKVSPGCVHCYAETLSKRYGRDIWGPAKTTDRWKTKGPWSDCIKWDEKALKAGERKKVFVMSMGDFFEDHPQITQWRWDALGILENFQALDVQLLTKRPENIPDMVPGSWMKSWPEHIWPGASVENQPMADKRIPELVRIPAKVHFLSIEPMLEPIDLQLDGRNYGRDFDGWSERIQWVIVGGESGPGYRPFSWDWARDIRDQCKAAGVAFFMKQGPGGVKELPEDLQIREFPR